MRRRAQPGGDAAARPGEAQLRLAQVVVAGADVLPHGVLGVAEAGAVDHGGALLLLRRSLPDEALQIEAGDDGDVVAVRLRTIPEGALFKTDDEKIFRKGEKIRKRFKCEEVKTRKIYLFSPIYEVVPL